MPTSINAGIAIAMIWLCISPKVSTGQSLEVMPGTERIFVDVQWLKFFDSEDRWSLFSRSRATVDYHENTNLFMGAYINYTTSSGFGGTVVGRISSTGAGADVGAHFFKASDRLLIYAIASLEVSQPIGYSWFSILRFTPPLGSKWSLYSSLELYSNYIQRDHNASVQRIRAGLGKNGYQFGLALNLAEFGEKFDRIDVNPGLLFRKNF